MAGAKTRQNDVVVAVTIPPDLETKARVSRKSKTGSQTHRDMDPVQQGGSRMLTGVLVAKSLL